MVGLYKNVLNVNYWITIIEHIITTIKHTNVQYFFSPIFKQPVKRADLITAFKVLKGLLDVDHNLLFSPSHATQL